MTRPAPRRPAEGEYDSSRATAEQAPMPHTRHAARARRRAMALSGIRTAPDRRQTAERVPVLAGSAAPRRPPWTPAAAAAGDHLSPCLRRRRSHRPRTHRVSASPWPASPGQRTRRSSPGPSQREAAEVWHLADADHQQVQHWHAVFQRSMLVRHGSHGARLQTERAALLDLRPARMTSDSPLPATPTTHRVPVRHWPCRHQPAPRRRPRMPSTMRPHGRPEPLALERSSPCRRRASARLESPRPERQDQRRGRAPRGWSVPHAAKSPS